MPPLARRRLPDPEPVGPGEESVWDYPRPPALERTYRHVRVELDGVRIASTDAAYRVLETSHPPAYYVPADGIEWEHLGRAVGSSFCEWKGTAEYWTVRVGRVEVVARAWSYPRPSPPFADLAGCVSFYPSAFECSVDDERARPQPGEFYGGWVTDDVKGPFKGAPGSMWW